MTTLTKADLKTIRHALHYGAQDRDGFAEAWSRKGPEATEAAKRVKDFDRLSKKLFGHPTYFTQQRSDDAKLKSTSIYDLKPTDERAVGKAL